jgi:hypothetical protein
LFHRKRPIIIQRVKQKIIRSEEDFEGQNHFFFVKIFIFFIIKTIRVCYWILRSAFHQFQDVLFSKYLSNKLQKRKNTLKHFLWAIKIKDYFYLECNLQIESNIQKLSKELKFLRPKANFSFQYKIQIQQEPD